MTKKNILVLPIMRKQKSGIIINISSAAGRFGYPAESAYVSSKFAIEGVSESMIYELEPFGIRVVLVEPGPIRTNFADGIVSAKKSQDPTSPYGEFMKKLNAVLASMRENASFPDLVAKVVLKAVTSENPSLRYLAGKDIETWMDAKRSMSDEDFRKTIKQNFMK